jgi:hypothetical protein
MNAALGDVDADGDLDAVVGVQHSPTTSGLVLWRNDGTGSFAFVEDLGTPIENVLQIVDVDGDGDGDLLHGPRLSTSRHWHLEAPFLAQVGTTYVLRFGGRAMPNALALPWFGVPASVPLPPLGTLGVDPFTAIPLAATVLPGEIGTTSFPIPANPALAGVTFAMQVLLFDGTSLHLTPSKRETVWR